MRAEPAEEKECMAKEKKRLSVKDGMRLICSAGVCIFLFFLVGIYSFYAPEGYIQIATNKYLFFRKLCLITAGVMTPFAVLYYILPSGKKQGQNVPEKISVTDLFMLLYLCLNIVSYYFTHFDSEQFISSMGNINWFCGFWSVFFVTGVVLYVIASKQWIRILSGIYSILALGLAAVEGSDSAFLSMGAVFFFLFLLSFQKTVYMKRLLELGIFYCAACQVMRVIVKLDRKSLSMDTSTMWLMLGNLTLVVLIVLCILRIFLEKKDREYKKYIELNKMGEATERASKERSKEISKETERLEMSEICSHRSYGRRAYCFSDTPYHQYKGAGESGRFIKAFHIFI